MEENTEHSKDIALTFIMLYLGASTGEYLASYAFSNKLTCAVEQDIPRREIILSDDVLSTPCRNELRRKAASEKSKDNHKENTITKKIVDESIKDVMESFDSDKYHTTGKIHKGLTLVTGPVTIFAPGLKRKIWYPLPNGARMDRLQHKVADVKLWQNSRRHGLEAC